MKFKTTSRKYGPYLQVKKILLIKAPGKNGNIQLNNLRHLNGEKYHNPSEKKHIIEEENYNYMCQKGSMSLIHRKLTNW